MSIFKNMLCSERCENLPSLGNITIFEFLSGSLRKGEGTFKSDKPIIYPLVISIK
ncbi:MAG: hypothetical protein U1C12_02730 [Patescibacteria group bacterium]|nr:hypothetical protein [Patescibacteria group bacterium]